MKKLYSSPDIVQIAELRAILDRAGIDSLITLGEQSPFVVAPGPLAFTKALQEISIARDEDFPQAAEILESWLQASGSGVATWQCSNCSETLEQQFDSCWQCGTKR